LERCPVNVELKDNILLLKEYKEQIENAKFVEILSEVEISAKEIDSLVDTYDRELKITIDKLVKVIQEKTQKPHLAIKVFDYSGFGAIVENLTNVFSKVQAKLLELIKLVKEFKNSFKNDSIQEDLNKITKAIDEFEIKQKRLDNNPICEEVKSLYTESNDIIARIDQKTQELEEKQSIYLKNYFDEINKFFETFGSTDFKVEKDISYKGNKPVIALKVLFKNKVVTDNQLPYVFSESDRRALALAIFWAKIQTMDKEDKNNTIIVLDDPVTSFDEHRLTRTINETITILEDVKQIIVFSHFHYFIERLLQICNDDVSPRLFNINRRSNTSIIELADSKTFSRTIHEKIFYRIIGYINREHQEDIEKELRVYYESEIKGRFRKQIIDLGLEDLNFKSVIDKLHENNIISTSLHRKMDRYRQTTNPEHHTFTTTNPDDVRATAKDLLNFIYSELYPNMA